MAKTSNSLLWIVCCAAPLSVALVVISRKREQWRARRQHPFREFKRRPAGESLRLRLVELEDKVVDCLLLLVGVPFTLMIVGGTLRWPGWQLPGFAFLASCIWTAVFGIKSYALLRERSDYSLASTGNATLARL